MPQSTPNLSLVTYDLTLDAGVYFSTFRSTLAGYTNSALTKIDTWAGQVNADLATLKQSPSIIRVSATKDSDFVYSATVLNMTQYSLNQYINLSLDSDNIGTVSLNINALGGKSLLKFNNAGTLVNISAKDLRQGKNNLFTYNGTAWVWVNAISSDQLNISGTSGNLVKISASNTLEDSGATFSNSVTNNAIVQRTATGQIKGATASANDDVVNKLYADTIDNKIGLLSSLETTDKTSVVGAINENFGHIEQIFNKGYVNSIVSTDCNSMTNNGKYHISNGTNQPVSGTSAWLVDVSVSTNTVSQIAKCTFGTPIGRIFSRSRQSDGTTWTSWLEIATISSYTIQSSDLFNGWVSGFPSYLHRVGNKVFAQITINSGSTTTGFVVVNVPIGYRPNSMVYGVGVTYSGVGATPINQFFSVRTDGNIIIEGTSPQQFVFIDFSWEV